MWRQEFARHLRDHGVEANASERTVRGKVARSMKDGIYRAARRGESTHMRSLIEGAMTSLAERRLPAEACKSRLLETRRIVMRGLRSVAQSLEAQGERRLSESIDRFVESMRPPRTARELMVEQLLQSVNPSRHISGRDR